MQGLRSQCVYCGEVYIEPQNAKIKVDKMSRTYALDFDCPFCGTHNTDSLEEKRAVLLMLSGVEGISIKDVPITLDHKTFDRLGHEIIMKITGRDLKADSEAGLLKTDKVSSGGAWFDRLYRTDIPN